MDRVESALSDIPPELITHIIKFCPKTNYNDLSLVCTKFLHITNGLTGYCKFKTKYKFKEPIKEGLLKRFNKLTSLDSNFSERLTDKDLARLPKLTSLNVANNQITDKGLEWLTNLTSLNLICNHQITNECLKYLPNLTVVIGRKSALK